MSYQDEVLGQLKAQTALLSTISKKLEALGDAQQGNSAYQWTPEGLPICGKHQEVMPKREKQGDAWFSHRIVVEGKELFCRGYASKSSPGWNIEPDDTTPPPPPPPPATPPATPSQAQEPSQPSTPQPAPQVSAIFNQPDLAPAPQPDPATNYHKLFYDIGGKAVQEKRIAFDKFNSLVSLANIDGWSAALAGLRLTLERGSV